VASDVAGESSEPSAGRGGRFSAGGTVRATLGPVVGVGFGAGEADLDDAPRGESAPVVSGVWNPEDEDELGNVPGSGVGGNGLEADDFGYAPDLGNTEDVDDLGNQGVDANLGNAEDGVADGKPVDAEDDGSGISDWR